MKPKFRSLLILCFVALLTSLAFWGCGGGSDGGSSSPEPTVSYSPVADYYNLVWVRSDKSLRCGVASNNEIDGDYEVAPPEDKNYTMGQFAYNAKIEEYFYGTEVHQASGVTNHTLHNPRQIRKYKDFAGSNAPEDPRGLFTFVNDGDFNTINNEDVEYPKEIRIQEPADGEEIEAGRSFKVRWEADDSEYLYFVMVEYAEVSNDGTITRGWTSEDMRSLNWADPLSIYSFIAGKTLTDKEISVPAALFTTQGAVNVSVYGFLPNKFRYDSVSKVGYELLPMGKQTVRINIVP